MGIRTLGVAAAILLLPFIGTSVAPAAAVGPVDHVEAGYGGAHDPGAPFASGIIEGRVNVPVRAPRRVAERYPAASAPSRAQLPIPAVAYLEGALPGTPSRPTSTVVALTQQDTLFTPALVVVPVGMGVDFPNMDPFFHNVFSYSRPKRFDLGRFSKGESKSITFDRPGYLKVFCEIHEWMRAAILVVENPYHAVVQEDGRFTIEGVPAGRHTITVIDFDRGSREVQVDVPEGGRVRVSVDF